MSDIENIKVLASIAHESGAYDDSYKYNSKILENEINNAIAWVNKGIAAAFLTDASGSKITEATVLIKKGIELGVDNKCKNNIITKIKEAYNIYVNQLNDDLLGKVKDFQKVGMPSGGSSILHGLNQAVNKIQTAQAQAAARIKGLEIVMLMCFVKPERDIFGLVNLALGNAQQHSKLNGDYLGKNPALQEKFNEYVRYVAKEAKDKCPDITMPAPTELVSNSAKKEGCFIATAATGSYDHPKVMLLRKYRDQKLMATNIGRLFVRIYYKISPYLAKYISRSNFLKNLVIIGIVNPSILLINKFTDDK